MVAMQNYPHFERNTQSSRMMTTKTSDVTTPLKGPKRRKKIPEFWVESATLWQQGEGSVRPSPVCRSEEGEEI